MSQSWLTRKRKGELLELAHAAKLSDAEGLLKDDLVELLQEHLDTNDAKYARNPLFSEYYGRSSSPLKRERVTPPGSVVMKTRRRQTLRVQDSDEVEAAHEEAPVTRTPRPVSTPRPISRLASRISEVDLPVTRVAPRMPDIDLPTSPAQLAEVADQSFQVAKEKATELWDRTRIDEYIELFREKASSIVLIQLAVLAVEGGGLGFKGLNTFHAGTIAHEMLPFSLPIWLPDVRVLFSSDFLAPTTMWSLTSWVLPLLVSYFFNLTLRSNTNHKSTNKEYTADPLTFNIVRAFLAYTAYYKSPTLVTAPDSVSLQPIGLNPWGPFSSETVQCVYDNVPGNFAGMQIGSTIGILYALYDAALKK